MPRPTTYAEYLQAQRDVRKVLVIKVPHGDPIEVASDDENIDRLVAVFAKLRESDPKRAVFGKGWTFELDTMDRYENSYGKVIMEYDHPASFPSPLMGGMVPVEDDGD